MENVLKGKRTKMKIYKIKDIRRNIITLIENRKQIGSTSYIIIMSISIVLFLVTFGIIMSKMLTSTEPDISSEKLEIEVTLDDEILDDKTENKVTITDDIIKNVEKYNYIKAYVNDNNSNEYFTFSINNDTDKEYKYRIVIEDSTKSTLDTKYIKYDLKLGDTQYKYGSKVKENKWTDHSQIKKTTYILYESVLDSKDDIKVNLRLNIDYENIDNDNQNKYWYGTIKVYAWED